MTDPSEGVKTRFNCLSFVQSPSKVDYCVVTTVALVGMALVAMALFTYFGPACAFTSGLGVIGADVCVSTGGLLFVISLAAFAVKSCCWQQFKSLSRKKSNTPSDSEKTSDTKPLLSPEETSSDGEGTVIFIPKDSATRTQSTSGDTVIIAKEVEDETNPVEQSLPYEQREVFGGSSQKFYAHSTLTRTLSTSFRTRSLRSASSISTIASEAEYFREPRQAFLEAMAEAMGPGYKVEKTSEFTKSQLETVKQELAKIVSHINVEDISESVKTISEKLNIDLILHDSGEHIVFEVPKLEGYIFKINKNKFKKEKTALNYTKRQREARELCENEDLYFLRIPVCNYVEINGVHVIVEERIKDVIGDYYSQCGLFEWGLEQEGSEFYFKELFRQLTIFVCKFGLADVKYNNTLITEGCQVALIDLDRKGALIGLTKGRAESGLDGLLSYLPNKKWLRETLEQVKELAPEVYKEINIKEMERRIKMKEDFRRKYPRYLRKNKISKIETPVPKLKSSKGKDQHCLFLAEKFIREINEELKNTIIDSGNVAPNMDLLIGRRVVIEIGREAKMFSEKESDKVLNKYPNLEPGLWRKENYNCRKFRIVQKHRRDALQLLKDQEIIFDFIYKDDCDMTTIFP